MSTPNVVQHEGTVCVTGASGFLAGHICAQLLAAGCQVRGTVRSLTNAKAIDYLKALPGAAERLELVEADLMKPNSFDAAVAGCSAVYHTASPVILLTDVEADEVVRPAVEGTLNVYESCNKAGVKRVVATSSFATIIFGHDHTVDETPYTDKEWNDYSQPWKGDAGHIYRYAKTTAERAGWEYVEKNKPSFKLVTINPPMIVGPWLPGYARQNDSSMVVHRMLTGQTDEANDGGMGWHDVRDVALAHILAGTVEGANGRYLIVTESIDWIAICQMLKELFPDQPVTSKKKEGAAKKPVYDITRTTEELGWVPKHTVREALQAQGDAFRREGLL